ncbi:phage tail terminator protein [Rhodoferax aquaticus]|uniref:Uncharacterized protein n=1 Tax=Rhodoferax aquaticus TaxID=2527691 RepID=A0A515ERM5_9BURK|nr:hypothetical protein [Rhodoferax aquaticus]QDL55304.1 hypothetical protein EXZ61_14635 [Rhodoferax aquaticus]
MDLDAVVTRVQASLGGLKAVGVSVDMEAAIGGAVPLPCAFVLPLNEVSTDQDRLSRVQQRVTQGFGVILVVSNKRDAKGAAALSDLKALRTALKNNLVGWVPDATNGEPVHHRSGRLLNLDGNARLWWIDEFELVTYWSQ